VTLEGFFENLSLLSPASILSDPQQLPPPDGGNGRPNGGVPPPKRGPKTGEIHHQKEVQSSAEVQILQLEVQTLENPLIHLNF